jgi:hypothetical protein
VFLMLLLQNWSRFARRRSEVHKHVQNLERSGRDQMYDWLRRGSVLKRRKSARTHLVQDGVLCESWGGTDSDSSEDIDLTGDKYRCTSSAARAASCATTASPLPTRAVSAASTSTSPVVNPRTTAWLEEAHLRRESARNVAGGIDDAASDTDSEQAQLIQLLKEWPTPQPSTHYDLGFWNVVGEELERPETPLLPILSRPASSLAPPLDPSPEPSWTLSTPHGTVARRTGFDFDVDVPINAPIVSADYGEASAGLRAADGGTTTTRAGKLAPLTTEHAGVEKKPRPPKSRYACYANTGLKWAPSKYQRGKSHVAQQMPARSNLQ